ncbi:hypothetical protein VB776_16355 [Arcicella sp. DC2W]|uniref:Uncharacterized protein n=1 Tax=Arcicella gelida TaxID=2984195 RepID=A0ABU5S7Q2_9BACT|nr:hypothetical protein [Arcicella sp. DC2W]MEA5404506.1 hypothetical protein [Arcicella sp. DC2W]
MIDINKLLENGIKTENTFKFDPAQLIILVGGFMLAGLITGFAFAAGQKAFK